MLQLDKDFNFNLIITLRTDRAKRESLCSLISSALLVLTVSQPDACCVNQLQFDFRDILSQRVNNTTPSYCFVPLCGVE